MFDPLPPPITKDNRDIAWEVALAYRRASHAAKAAGASPPECEEAAVVLDRIADRRSNTGDHSERQRLGATLAQLERLPGCAFCRRGACPLWRRHRTAAGAKQSACGGRNAAAHPDPAPKILLDRSAAENALEVVVAFATANDDVATIKSDLIQALHDALSGRPPIAPPKPVPERTPAASRSRKGGQPRGSP
jgi:hypothetical protein